MKMAKGNTGCRAAMMMGRSTESLEKGILQDHSARQRGRRQDLHHVPRERELDGRMHLLGNLRLQLYRSTVDFRSVKKTTYRPLNNTTMTTKKKTTRPLLLQLRNLLFPFLIFVVVHSLLVPLSLLSSARPHPHLHLHLHLSPRFPLV
jgi:hypothetical protein